MQKNSFTILRLISFAIVFVLQSGVTAKTEKVFLQTFFHNIELIKSRITILDEHERAVFMSDNGECGKLYRFLLKNNANTSLKGISDTTIIFGMDEVVINRISTYEHYLSDSSIVYLCALGLGLDDKGSSKKALYCLMNYVNPKVLVLYSDTIKKYFYLSQNMTPNDSLRLLQRLPLNTLEKEALKKRFPKDEVARAIFGDTLITARMISDFKKEQEYNNKATLAEYLGRIGTPACAKALLSELGTDIRKHQQEHLYDERGRITNQLVYAHSVRTYIIEALSMIHPDEPLLNHDFMEIKNLGMNGWIYKKLGMTPDTQLAREKYMLSNPPKSPEGTALFKAYFDKIIAWGKKTYGIVPDKEILDPYW